MNNESYSIVKYYNQDTNKERYAVLANPSNVYYFPTRYGLKPAKALCKRLNKECK